jgi:ElaB/YqjD/DUF883 family membrane-anchored ribosome-binding protein
MSSGDQGQPQGQGRPDEGQGRHDGGAREQIQNVGRRIQEGAEQASQRLREGLDSARDEAARRYRRVEGTIARNPAPSVLLGFGIGFGLGLILTTMLVGEEETWAERHLPDSIRRRIPDSLRHAPDKISELADAIRDLPDQIARRLPSNLRG